MTFPTGQEIVQTYCSAKDGKSAKLGSILAGLVSAAYAIVPAIIGLLAYVCIDGYVLAGSQKCTSTSYNNFCSFNISRSSIGSNSCSYNE